MPLNFQDQQLSSKLAPKTAETVLGAVEYAEIGAGPVVVAIHGAMGGCDQSLILAQTIGNSNYHYLAISRPGYLGTPISSGKSAEKQGDLIAALLDALHIGKAGVMAVSGGGPSALQFALRHPDRCAGLVLVSTYACKVDTPIPFSFKIMKYLARWSWFAKKFREKTAGNLKEAAKRSIRDPEILASTINDTETWPLFSTPMLSTFERMGQRLDGTENDIKITRTTSYPLEDLAVPVLVVHGTQDQHLPFEVHAKMLENRVPNVELLTVEGGDHVAIFTHRNQVKARVHDFMQSHFANGEIYGDLPLPFPENGKRSLP